VHTTAAGARHAVRWLGIGVLIGLASGAGVLAFRELSDVVGRLLLGDLGGYRVPAAGQRRAGSALADFARPWAIPLVVGLGGIVAGLVAGVFLDERDSHGTDGALEAAIGEPRSLRGASVAAQLVAGAVTIGSGGAAGPEGPVTQVGAGAASWLARRLDLSPGEGRVALAVGIGSGIGAVFAAPLGGAVLCAEIVYRDDAEYAAVLPGLAASIVASLVVAAVDGSHPLFALPPGAGAGTPLRLVWFALLGLVAGGLGVLYALAYRHSSTTSIKVPRALRAGLGGLLVGSLAVGLPEVLGSGAGWVQLGLDGALSSLPLLVVVALPFARILATCLTLGSGGSGGVFTPALGVGGLAGLALWRVLADLGAPHLGADPALFVVVGAAAALGGITRAPVGVVLVVIEATGAWTGLLPATLAVLVALGLARASGVSLFVAQPASRHAADSKDPERPPRRA